MATELATRPPAFVDGKTQSANDMRLNILSGSGGATPLQSRAGVRPSGGNPGLVAALVTPVMKVRVNAGIADVPSSSVTGGFYRVSWDQVDLDIDPSSAQTRTDLIIVEVVDTGTSAATGKVRVLKGASGGGRPSNPVVNAHWWSLAATTVRVNAESTGNIRPQDVTPELQYAVAPGAPIPVSSQAERDTLTAYPGLRCIRLDRGGDEELYRDGAWRGTRILAYSAVPLNTAVGFTAANNTLRQIAIPDPGYPYRLLVNGMTWALVSPGSVWNLLVRLDNNATGTLIRPVGEARSTTYAPVSVQNGLSDPLTGSHTVLFCAARISGLAGDGFQVTTEPNVQSYTVQVIPE